MNIKKVNITLNELSPVILELLDGNIKISLPITGNSMYPLFTHERDRVILAKCDKAKLKKGDIPLYKRNNGKYVLHRIVRVNKNSYDLCGDNQCAIEKNLCYDNIIAVVRGFERNGRYYDCDNFIYKLYWHMRIFSIPFRSILLSSFGRIRSKNE